MMDKVKENSVGERESLLFDSVKSSILDRNSLIQGKFKLSWNSI